MFQRRGRRRHGARRSPFGMGIDKPDVRFVAHLDLPKSDRRPITRKPAARGRDSMPANAWMAYGLGDVVQQRKMIDESDADGHANASRRGKLDDALLGLCEAARAGACCFSAYFGESSKPCGNCDTLSRAARRLGRDAQAQMALSCVFRAQRASGFHFGCGPPR